MAKGWKHTEEARKKLSEANLARYARGEKFGFQKGHSSFLTDESKSKTSKTMKGIRPKNFGVSFGGSKDNHPNWKGGISATKEYRAYYARVDRLRRRGAVGTFTRKEWEELKSKYNSMCLCCKQQEPFIKLTADHVVPLARGGTNDISNIQPLCNTCNSRKFTKAIDYRVVPGYSQVFPFLT